MRHGLKLLCHHRTQRRERMLHLSLISKDLLVTFKKLEELVEDHVPVNPIIRFNVFVHLHENFVSFRFSKLILLIIYSEVDILDCFQIRC